MRARSFSVCEEARRRGGHDKETHMMRTTLLAGSAAVCALAGVLAISTPGQAQSDYPQTSSPAEQQQTRALNQQATDGTTQSPAVLNGQDREDLQQASGYGAPPASQGMSGLYNSTPGNYGDQPQPGEDQGPPSAQQQQYDSQMQQYGQQQQQYQGQRQQYDSDAARYRANLRAYDRAMYDWTYPAPIAYEYGEERGLQRLYLIAEPSQQLHQAPVEGPDGRWVGRVRNVETAPDGRPSRVEIALNRRVSVWVQPGDLRFDPEAGVLFTDMTRADLWQMPGATVESGPM
jgi:hypothetical protein